MPEPRPNILFVNLDQLRYDATGRSRAGLVATPHLDRFADEGAWFEHAYTPIPTCCPARQSLLSGEWPDRHGGLWNYDNFLPVRLFDRPTWSKALSEAGYRTGYIGKWHVHPTRGPEAFGYEDVLHLDEYDAWRQAQNLPDYERDEVPWFGGADPGPTEHSRPYWLADRAAEWIERYAAIGRPWHLRLEFEEPHIPCFPTYEFLERYPEKAIEPWGNFPDPFRGKPYIQPQMLVTWGLEDWTWDRWRPLVARYRAIVTQLDAAFGRVLAALDRAGVRENTLVVFTSDHGDACGSHGMIDKHYVMYDEVVRVPLAVRWPRKGKPGTRSDAFTTHFIDLAATMYEAAKLPIPDRVQGRSLMPLLRGRVPADWPEAAFSTYNGQQFGLYVQRMIRTRRWKYVWNMTDVDELYDLESDPAELKNRVADPDATEVLQELRQRLFDHLEERSDDVVMKPFVRPQLLEGRKLARRGSYEKT